MEIKVKIEDKVKLNYGNCPCCGKSFNTKARKKTFHHAIPKFLKPHTEVEVSLCKECHDDLNGYYVHQAAGRYTSAFFQDDMISAGVGIVAFSSVLAVITIITERYGV